MSRYEWLALALRAVELDCEAHSEEDREQRYELAGNEAVDERLDYPVGWSSPQHGGLEIDFDRRVETAHIRGKDPKERDSAEDVDLTQTFGR
jgi:hypothetical protein